MLIQIEENTITLPQANPIASTGQGLAKLISANDVVNYRQRASEYGYLYLEGARYVREGDIPELKANKYEGVVQEQLPTALNNLRECKLRVLEILKPLVLSIEIPVPPGRVSGWVASLNNVSGAGGGDHSTYPSRTVLVTTPAAIDIRPFLPAGLSQRNVFIAMLARTDHNVVQPGRWVYYVKFVGAPNSYTQCTNFEFQSDGVPIGGGPLPILQQRAALTTDASIATNQRRGYIP
jgi:hypothetical protein